MTFNQERGTTEQFAREHLVKPQTVLKRHCETGSYFGVVPKKLENGRLAWPLGGFKSESGQEVIS